MDHKGHAEDVSWPLKKTDEPINDNDKLVKVNFAPAEEVEFAAAA